MKSQEFNTGNVAGDVIGPGTKGVAAREIHGNVIQIIIKSDEIARQLGKLTQIPTEVQQSQAAGVEGNILSPDSGQLQENINALLEIINSSSSPGRNINEVKAGDLHISKVDLLLKKAVLLKTDADQMYFDQIGKTGSEEKNPEGKDVVDMNALLADFDDTAHTGKLREAYELLEEANQLDPTNTEVLLHMAQLLIELTPDDPGDEQKLLYRIRNLLSNPKDDSERFRLAQATFLLATTDNTHHEGMLRDARSMFDKLGRTEWVRQCDDLLNRQVYPEHEITQQSGFQPAGYWHVKVSDYLSSTMQLNLHPNGYFEVVQQAGMYGVIAQANGQWAFMPQQQLLQLQGLVNGMQPFMLGILIQNQQGNTFYGIGTDSYSYVLQKA